MSGSDHREISAGSGVGMPRIHVPLSQEDKEIVDGIGRWSDYDRMVIPITFEGSPPVNGTIFLRPANPQNNTGAVIQLNSDQGISESQRIEFNKIVLQIRRVPAYTNATLVSSIQPGFEEPGMAHVTATATARVKPDVWQLTEPLQPNPRLIATGQGYDAALGTFIFKQASSKLASGLYENPGINSSYCVAVQLTQVNNNTREANYSYGFQQKPPVDTHKFPSNQNDLKGYAEGLSMTMSLMKEKGVFQQASQTQTVIPIKSSSFPADDKRYVGRIMTFLNQARLNKIEMNIILSPEDKAHLNKIIQRAPAGSDLLANAKILNQMGANVAQQRQPENESTQQGFRPRR
jgi:hypothetical protein